MKGAISGSLELVCGPDSSGKPSLRRQFCEPPFHVGKGYVEGDRLTVQVANPSAGVFSGDRLKVHIRVEGGSQLVVKTPAATSFFPGSGTAIVDQKLEIEKGSSLEWLPQPMIPHAGARVSQSLNVEIQAGATFLGAEMIAPGRVASGEVLAFQQIELRCQISIEGIVAAKERFLLDPQHEAWVLRKEISGSPFFATIWLAGCDISNHSHWREELESRQTKSLWIGSTNLHHKVVCVRVISSDSVEMRKTVDAVVSGLRAAGQAAIP